MRRSAFAWKLQTFKKVMQYIIWVDVVHEIIRQTIYVLMDYCISLIGEKKSVDVHRKTDNNRVLQDRSCKELDSVGDNKSSCLQLALSTGAMPKHSMRVRPTESTILLLHLLHSSKPSKPIEPTVSNYHERSLQQNSAVKQSNCKNGTLF